MTTTAALAATLATSFAGLATHAVAASALHSAALSHLMV